MAIRYAALTGKRKAQKSKPETNRCLRVPILTHGARKTDFTIFMLSILQTAANGPRAEAPTVLLRHCSAECDAGTLPLDYYKELVASYRRLAGDLDMRDVEDCMALYGRADGLFEMIQREVL